MCRQSLELTIGETEARLIHFSVFVNGRARPVVMENMRERIARGDIKQERVDAIEVNSETQLG